MGLVTSKNFSARKNKVRILLSCSSFVFVFIEILHLFNGRTFTRLFLRDYIKCDVYAFLALKNE